MSIRRGLVPRIGALLAFLMIGCVDDQRNQELSADADAPETVFDGSSPEVDVPSSVDREDSAAPVSSEGVVLFLGTSLTAGQGLPREESFPLLIQGLIDSEDLPYRVVNAGVSGETSAGALRRIDWLLQQEFDVLVLETGANDMLRGVDPSTTERNLSEIIERVQARRPEARILLLGMLAAPNLGSDFGQRFAAIYPDVADRYGVELVPFLLEGVAAVPALNLADGIHPNAAGHRMIAQTVWSGLAPILER